MNQTPFKCSATSARLGGFENLEPGSDVDAIVGRRLLVDRFLLRLHDIGQRGVARLVEAQVGGDDRRQLERHRLHAAVDLAGDFHASVLDDDLGGEGPLTPEDLALGVDGPPKVDHSAVDFQIDLVQMPSRIRFQATLS